MKTIGQQNLFEQMEPSQAMERIPRQLVPIPIPDPVCEAILKHGTMALVASMTFRVGAELTDRIAAISPNAGACWTQELKLSGSLSLCYITGTSDTLNPIDGGYPRLAFGGKNQEGPKKPPVQETIDKWIKAMGGVPNAESDISKDGVRTRRYGTSHQGAEVEYITIEGLGHHWAGGNSQAPELLVGKNTKKWNATDVVWDFFVKHPKE